MQIQGVQILAELALFFALSACFLWVPKVRKLTDIVNTISALLNDIKILRADAQAKLSKAMELQKRSAQELRDAENMWAHAKALYTETNARKADK